VCTPVLFLIRKLADYTTPIFDVSSHQSLLRPLTTIILLLLAGAQHFVHTHPLSNGILNFVVAAIVTFLTEARDVILAELSAKHPKMVYHTGK
jgi:hypothetical protein